MTRPASYPDRKGYLESHLLGNPARKIPPHPLAAVRVGALTTADLTRLYADRLQAGYAPATVRELHGKIRALLRWALSQNVPVAAAVLGMPPPAVQKPERLQLSPAQVRRLLRETADDPYGCLWRLTWYCATRLGEALALRWSDVDLGARRVSVRRILVSVTDGEGTYREGKTKQSQAALPIPDDVVEALRRHFAAQEARRARFGPAWRDQGLVFDRGDGASFYHTGAERAWYATLDRLKLPRCRLHDLRGASGSALLEAGHGLVDIQRRLRHADIGTTVGIYLQPTSAADERAAATLERLVLEGS
ncbi:MAG TPA: site-specific integrase [Chloroflexota bacterium]